jgi:hypothetical protein
VRRAVFVVLLSVVITLLTFDVSGLAALCDDGACDEPCPTDFSGGKCPPNCHDCSCCSLPKVTASATLALIAPSARPASWVGPIDRLPAPEPADILHVPKSLLA